MIEVKDLSFNYKNKSIIKNLNFNITDKGKFITIIGPNGCGKTTLMNLMTGNLKPNSGDIFYNNKKISSYSIRELSKYIALVKQKQNINFPYTCLDIVTMGRNPYKERLSDISKKDLEIVLDAMKKTETIQFADKLITKLSGGEFQRVMLAKALSQTPQVLFLDEAFSAMDIAYKVNNIKLLKKIIEEKGITVISIMHDINLAYRFSDKMCVIKDGNIIRYGNPTNIIDSDFINETFNIKVNLIEGKGFLIA